MDWLRKGIAAASAAAAEDPKPRADCRLAFRASLYRLGLGTKEGLLDLCVGWRMMC